MKVQEVLERVNWPGVFLTGSRAWGLEKPHSDWDLVCPACMETQGELLVAEVWASLTGPDPRASKPAYFHSEIVHADDGQVQLVYLAITDVHVWYHATELMKVFPLHRGRSKTEVYGIFEGLRALVKLHLSHSGQDFHSVDSLGKLPTFSPPGITHD